MARRAGAALVATVVLALLAGCTSTRLGVGHGSGAPLVTSASQPAPVPSASAPSSSESRIAPVPGGLTPCPQSDPTQATTCLRGVLSDFWSGQLNTTVDEPIVIDAVTAQVPPECRPGIAGGTAFTCKSDLTLYVTHAFLTLIDEHFQGVDRALALASVASHEIGHVLQYSLHQPEIEKRHPSDATRRTVEQQADCLSGVWAGQAAAHHSLDADRFVTDAVNLIELVSSNPEIETHGSPPQRRAAIERGLAGGSAGVCNLATFH
jgi:predicted metalloprotease